MTAAQTKEKPAEHVLTWDGKGFEMMQRRTAQQLARQGKIQIAENAQDTELLTADQLAETAKKAKRKPAKKPAAKKKAATYKTRDMKAE